MKYVLATLAALFLATSMIWFVRALGDEAVGRYVALYVTLSAFIGAALFAGFAQALALLEQIAKVLTRLDNKERLDQFGH